MATAVLAAVPAHSHDHATGVVRERMELMEGMAKRMKAIRAHIERKRELPAALADAKALATSAAHVAHLFPPGSTQKPTEATAAVWTDWAGFERIARALEAESAKLAAMKPDDADALNAQFRAVSATCGGCHERYRVKQ